MCENKQIRPYYGHWSIWSPTQALVLYEILKTWYKCAEKSAFEGQTGGFCAEKSPFHRPYIQQYFVKNLFLLLYLQPQTLFIKTPPDSNRSHRGRQLSPWTRKICLQSPQGQVTTDERVQIDRQCPASGVYSIMMVNSAHVQSNIIGTYNYLYFIF